MLVAKSKTLRRVLDENRLGPVEDKGVDRDEA
jgi:hypothetical protein